MMAGSLQHRSGGMVKLGLPLNEEMLFSQVWRIHLKLQPEGRRHHQQLFSQVWSSHLRLQLSFTSNLNLRSTEEREGL